MSTKKTENLNLHAWEKTDAFRMDEFNDNFDKLDQAVAAKAEQTALDTLSGRVDKKAEQTVLDAALAALAGRVGALEDGKLVWKFDTYTGNGNSGKNNSNRLTFDFKPLMLIVADPTAGGYGSIPWLNGQAYGLTHPGTNNGISVNLTWEDRAVKWYCTDTSNNAMYQLNLSSVKYPYLALGIEE